MKQICKFCEVSFDSPRALIKHINGAHRTSSQEYYDTFLRKENEGKCPVCSGATSYRGFSKGYLTYCSNSCRGECSENRHKISLAKIGVKQSDEHIRKRLNSTDQKMKEETKRNTLLERYGVTNPSQLEQVRTRISEVHKGSKKPRTSSHQNNIIHSKTINGTLAHSEATKKKISEAIQKSKKMQKAKELGLFVTSGNNSKTLNGKFKNIHFRSSYELSFLLEMHLANIEVVSAENNLYRIQYEYNGKKSYYYPDFFVPSKNCLIEIKPKGMIEYGANPSKFSAANQHCQKNGISFEVYTEDNLLDVKNIIKKLDNKFLQQHLVIFKNEHLCFG